MKNYFSLVTFSHTIFALPFALLGFVLAIMHPDYSFSWKIFGLIILCMITARNAAMGFNRYADRIIDEQNERTKNREIPSGVLKSNHVLIFVFINAILFVISTFFINRLCFYLSPVALLVVLGYSYTKRFTALCHLVLGLGLSFAPVGAYMAVTGAVAILPLLYGLVVLFWVSGFDIIYALQDEYFDRRLKLYSIPGVWGGEKALLIARIFHTLVGLILITGTWILYSSYESASLLAFVGFLFFMMALVYQHKLVTPNELSRINKVFFTTNGVASLLYGMIIILDLTIL
ncbi:MAG TPA: UbiA-like polyprenyltransferase [Saprospiraceae bacterium]|nr:UbiA-like polyprenyltransferase [Saprospiraceae bacterium]